MATLFQTPSNEKSFSALIDNVVMASGKPQSVISIVAYANATIRECQTLGLFARDLIEDTISVPSSNTTNQHIWDRPSNLFRSLRTVKYISDDVYPELILPGRKAIGKTYFFYASDNYYVFNGCKPGETIAIAQYFWARRLDYFARLDTNTASVPGGPYTTRPAYYDSLNDEWLYLNSTEDAYVNTLGDTTEEAARRLAAINWLIEDWYDVIFSGTKAKILAASNDPRAATEYSIYKQLQKSMVNTVGLEGEGF